MLGDDKKLVLGTAVVLRDVLGDEMRLAGGILGVVGVLLLVLVDGEDESDEADDEDDDDNDELLFDDEESKFSIENGFKALGVTVRGNRLASLAAATAAL